jgi:hypothetical protein
MHIETDRKRARESYDNMLRLVGRVALSLSAEQARALEQKVVVLKEAAPAISFSPNAGARVTRERDLDLCPAQGSVRGLSPRQD